MKIKVRERAQLRDDRMTKIALAQTDRALLDLYCLTPGQEQKPHTHTDQDKIYYVLEGRGTIVLDGRDEPVEAGEAVVVPAGTPHGILNSGPAPLLALVVVTPPPAHAR